jgi:multidrug resistance protein
MASKKSQLGIIFLTVLIDLIGFGIVIPVLPRYAEHFGASVTQNGWLVGVFSLAQFIFSPIWGRVSDRIGRKPVLVVSIFCTALGYFLMGFASTLTALFVARILAGISTSNIGTAQAYIADVTTKEERSKAMGLLGAAFGLGFILGPAIGGVMSAHFGFASPMYLAAAMAACNAVLVFFILPESLSREFRGMRDRQSILSVFQHTNSRVYGTLLTTYFFLIAGFSMMTALFALYSWHRFHLDVEHTGWVLALVGFIGALIQGGMIGKLVKRFGEKTLASTGALILCASLFGLPLCGSVGLMLLATTGIAIGNSLLMPTLTGLASRNVDAQWQGRALGVMQSCGSLARWAGPVTAGWLLNFDLSKPANFYARTPFWAGASLLAITFVLTLFLPQTQPAASVLAEPSSTP